MNKLFGKDFLGEISYDEFFEKLPDIYGKVGNRCLLRAFHFFNENQRVSEEVSALKSDDFNSFLNLVKESGDSSYKYLQNIYSVHDIQNQSVAVGLALSQQIIQGNGVCRVHGGGFAGTIQAFIKTDFVENYKNKIELIFGKDSCHILRIRKYGGIRVF